MKLKNIKSYKELQVERIIVKLNKLTDDEILTESEVAEFLGIGTTTLRQIYASNKVILNNCTQLIKIGTHIKRMWGNNKTIAKVRKEHTELCK